MQGKSVSFCARARSRSKSALLDLRVTLAALLLLLAGCTSINYPVNTPAAGSRRLAAAALPDTGTDTAIALSFSGGGTRAAAFAFGVLRGLEQMPGSGIRSRLDEVAFVSGVSGGSVAAAYFGLKGRMALTDFRERFLTRNAEESLRTAVDLGNLAAGLGGGVNDATRFPAWLDANLFERATLGDLMRPGRPIVWINASDLFNHTPFVFSQTTFSALCSDIGTFPLSQAVAASAAVPVAFVPIVLESFPKACPFGQSAWIDRVLADRDSGAQLRAFAEALMRYRDPDQIRYLKLADGGITDNFGLSGLVIARAAASEPYMPLTPERAVSLRRIIFVVVNAGQAPSGNWSLTLDGPSGAELIDAVTDTAIKSAVRSGFDAFRLSIREWEAAVRKWRCALPSGEARRLGARPGWRCSDVRFDITQVSFDRLPPDLAARLSAIQTRFRLPEEEVDLLIRSGAEEIRADPVLGPSPVVLR
jgi:NTE family protein